MATVHFTSDTFDADVLHGSGTVLVDFWAPWCGPCKMLGPVIEELAGDYDGKAVVGKLNIDDNQDLAVKFGVMTIPTVIVFKNGQEVSRIVGIQSKQTFGKMIDNA